MPSESGGKRMGEIMAAIDERQRVTFRCSHCRRFRFRGSVTDGRAIFAEHMRSKHPEVPLVRPSRRTSRMLGSFKQVRMSVDEANEIEAERLRRAFLNGIAEEVA